jgi:uncharacterized protein (TIGR01319 family)
MRPILSFDIGSTYTKGALFDLDSRPLRLLCRDAVPTMVADLAVGFNELRKRLLGSLSAQTDAEKQSIPVYACSSAKGGLAIAALGIVPDLTLHVAKLAAASAGGKIVAEYAYRLTEDQVAELKRNPPDVVLFSGGTDGGNEDYVLRNAKMLAEARLPSVVLYAGNAGLTGEIRGILGQCELCIAENLMPEVGKLAIEPARAKIQEIFLKKIVEGKGLGDIRSQCAGEIKPTPRAVFELLEAMSTELPYWNDFALIDVGGATTDCYSCSESFCGEDGYVLKGLCEPKLKRTVEGDLGLRISARSAAETGREYIERQLAESPFSDTELSGFIAKISAASDYLPQSAEEGFFDDVLAGTCVYHALRRHAGSIEARYSANGKVFVQQGKDLRRVKKIIVSGGVWQKQVTDCVCQTAIFAARRDAQGLQLLPENVEFYLEKQCSLPLLGNLAIDFPHEASEMAEDNLKSF